MTGKGMNRQVHVRDHDDALMELDLNPRWRHLGKPFLIDDCEE
jgi:hypothetical protein